MRICPECGTNNSDDARFCEHCGRKLDTDDDMMQEKNQDGELTETIRIVRETDGEATREFQTGADREVKWEEQTGQRGKSASQGSGRLSLLQIIVIGEAVCLAVVIAAFFVIGFTKYNPRTVAEKYFSAYASRDWAAVYDLLEFPEDSTMQEEQFADMMDRTQTSDITNYTVKAVDGEDSDIARNFDVEYSVPGEGASELRLTVVRQSSKALFLFDVWKISAAGMITDGYSVVVPSGAKAAVDGVELNDKYKVEDGSEGTDMYQISVFNGVHSIEVAVPWCELYEGEFDTSADSSATVTELTPSETGAKALQAKMEDALERFYTSAAAGEDYSEVSDLFTESAAPEYKSVYDDLKESLASESGDYYTMNQITFDNFRCDFNVEAGLITGEMDCGYTMEYTYKYSGFGSSGSQSKTSEGSAYMRASFAYDGTTYRIQKVSMPTVWWY